MQEQNLQGLEPNMRLNIKQSAKGSKYWDITVRANDIEEIKQRLEQLKQIATEECGE